jgi:hypothetical protein
MWEGEEPSGDWKEAAVILMYNNGDRKNWKLQGN